VNSDGTFQDAQGLHKLLFNGYTLKRLEARTYNLGVGFTQGVWRKNGSLGFKHESYKWHNCLDVPLKETISKLRRGLEANCETLAFRIPSDSRMKKNAEQRNENLPKEEKLFKIIFEGGGKLTPKNLKQEVIKHELKHVIDSVIRNSNYEFFVETPAHLYSGANFLWGLKRDFNNWHERLKNRIENVREKLEEEKSLNFPEVMIEGRKKILDMSQKRLEQFEKDRQEQYTLFKGFIYGKSFDDFLTNRDELSWQDGKAIMSYLFSTMPREKMVEKVRDVLERVPNQTSWMGTRCQNKKLV
jgi:hypothetical protein